MQRSIFYPMTQWRSFDVVSGFKDVAYELSQIVQDILGITLTEYMVSNLPVGPTAPASAAVIVGAGDIYMPAEIDPTAAGALLQDSSVLYQRGGVTSPVTVPITLADLAAGQSVYFLICAKITTVDTVRVNDPTGGLLSFWNSASPFDPLIGFEGDRETLPTERSVGAIFTVVEGVPAATGDQTIPMTPAGFVAIATALQAYGQTSFAAGTIAPAPGVPRLAGLLNSHHGGVPGQAPKINLATETVGTLPGASLLASTATKYGAGAYYWECPEGVSEVRVRLWGAGGGSGAADGTQSGPWAGSGGGYAEAIVPVVPGTQYGLIVGTGGVGGTDGGAGTAGGSTGFGEIMAASGGGGGHGSAQPNYSSAGGGYVNTEFAELVLTANGAGGGRNYQPTSDTAFWSGAIGGWSAFFSQFNGGAGITSAGGTPPNPGGGAGAPLSLDGSAQAGGNGADGLAILEY